MVVAVDPAAPGQRIGIQFPGGLMHAQAAQVPAQVVLRSQGAGVVRTEDAAPPGKGVLVHLARRLDLPELAQVGGHTVAGRQRVGVVVSQDAPPVGQHPLKQRDRPGHIA